jgi:DNA-binding transcriptional MerR regulator
MAKAKDAFRTIREVSDTLDTPTHVLRFWESKFRQIKPVKRAGGRRYYRPDDIALLAGIKDLLHEQGMTIKGAQKLLREKGVKHVVAHGQSRLDATPEISEAGAETIDITPVLEESTPPPPAPQEPPALASTDPGDEYNLFTAADTRENMLRAASETAVVATEHPSEPQGEPEEPAEPETSPAISAHSFPDVLEVVPQPSRFFHVLQTCDRSALPGKEPQISTLITRLSAVHEQMIGANS